MPSYCICMERKKATVDFSNGKVVTSYVYKTKLRISSLIFCSIMHNKRLTIFYIFNLLGLHYFSARPTKILVIVYVSFRKECIERTVFQLS